MKGLINGWMNDWMINFELLSTNATKYQAKAFNILTVKRIRHH